MRIAEYFRVSEGGVLNWDPREIHALRLLPRAWILELEHAHSFATYLLCISRNEFCCFSGRCGSGYFGGAGVCVGSLCTGDGGDLCSGCELWGGCVRTKWQHGAVA